MPGTLDHVAIQCPFIEWTTSMGTCRRDGIELQTPAHQDNRDARGSDDTIESVFLDTVQRHDSLVALVYCLPVRVVDTGTLHEDHITTKIGGNEDGCQTNEAEDGCDNVLIRRHLEAQNNRDEVEHRRRDIEEGMIQARSSLGTIGIAPVR